MFLLVKIRGTDSITAADLIFKISPRLSQKHNVKIVIYDKSRAQKFVGFKSKCNISGDSLEITVCWKGTKNRFDQLANLHESLSYTWFESGV